MSKPFKSIDKQITLLRSRGMTIEDDGMARHALETVSYYRLSGYSYPFREYSPENAPECRSNHFIPGTSFDQIIRLYNFDTQLRFTVFEELSKIEVSLRAMIGYQIGAADPLLHMNPSSLNERAWNADEQKERRLYKDWQYHYENSLKNSKEIFVQHHLENYGGTLPIWCAVHILDWGSLQTLFSMLPKEIRRQIAAKLQLTPSVLDSWLNCLRVIRNISAHHSRLFNRSLPNIPTIPHSAKEIGIMGLSQAKNKCFDQLTLVQYLTRTMGLGDGTALPSVLAAFPATDVVPLRATGTPDNWQSLPLWACDTLRRIDAPDTPSDGQLTSC